MTGLKGTHHDRERASPRSHDSRMAGSNAPRVCTTEQLLALAAQVRPGIALATARSAIEGLEQSRALLKVSKGLYLNRRSRPAAELSEAAQHLRHGAVVSLQTVLGECGFLNNPPAVVTAVLPLPADKGPRPNLGEVKTSGGQVFRFRALPARFFPASVDDERLMLQAGRFCPVVRPEVALLHWLYLAHSPRSSMLSPPQDVDFSVLDMDLLASFAWRWDLSRTLQEWMQRVQTLGDPQEPSRLPSSQNISPSSSRPALSERAAQARARMMARRALRDA